jgi:hypothetical protein
MVNIAHSRKINGLNEGRLSRTLQRRPAASYSGVFAADDDARSLWSDRLVMSVATGNRKDLSRPIRRWLIVLCHREAASDNETANREMVFVMFPSRSWFESFNRYFRITVSQKFRFEIVLIH